MDKILTILTDMKYSFGDLVYHTPTFCIHDSYANPLQIIGYDPKRKKYKCMDFSLGYIYEVLTIWYCNENELDYLENVANVNDYLVDGIIPFPDPNIDDTYYEHYDVDGTEIKQIGRASCRERV